MGNELKSTPLIPAEQLSPERFEAILSSISDGVFTVDSEWRLTCFNRAAENITGYKREEVIGQLCHDILRSNICQSSCALRYTMETGNLLMDLSITITSKTGETIPVNISTAILRDKEGRIIGGVETFRDLRTVEKLRKELENIVEHSFVLCHSETIHKEHLPPEVLPDHPVQGEKSLTLREIEADSIKRALERNNWNRLAASRELGIHKTTLFRKIRNLDLDLPPIDGRSSVPTKE